MSDLPPQPDPTELDEWEPSSGYAWDYSGDATDWEAQASLHVPEPAAAPEGTFGPYEIRQELGRGGMGVVFLAHDPDADREIALKVILDRNLSDVRKARFQREGQVTAKLSHPGIVRVHTAGEFEGLLFLAYELVEDCRELKDAFEGRDRTGKVELIRDAARALGFAHEHEVVHRDVKPANVLVDGEGRVKVTDFGLAAVRGGDRLTQTGAFVGTPTHMAPEQFSTTPDNPVGPHSDVWALGVMLYTALTGQQPFQGDTLIELGANIVEANPARPRDLDAEVPEDLEAICLKALSKLGKHRYVNATELANDLDRALRGEPVSASSGTHSGLRALARRWPAWPMVTTLVATFLLLGGALVWVLRPPDRLTEELTERDALVRLRRLDERSKLLLATRRALASDADAIAKLAREVRRLEQMQLSPADRETLGVARDRLHLMQGLMALSRGDGSQARSVKVGSRSSDLSEGLHGALLAGDASTPADANAADRAIVKAIAAGCDRTDLHAWHALAFYKAGQRDPRLSAASLAHLQRLAQGHDGALPEPLRLLEARLQLLLDRIPEAAEAIDALKEPPRDLLLELLFARVGLLLDEDQPRQAQALLGRSPIDRSIALEARRRLYLHCQRDAEKLFAARTLAARPAIAVLEIMRLLEPDTPLPTAHIEGLVNHVVVVDTRAIPLVKAVSALAGDDYDAQIALSRHIVRTENQAVVRPHLDVVRRPVAVARNEQERLEAQATLAFALWEVNEYAACRELCDELIPKLPPGQLRSRLYLARGTSRRYLGDLEGSLEDIDASMARTPGGNSRARNLKIDVLLTLERWDEAWSACVDYAEVAPELSAKHIGVVANLWSLSHRLQRFDEIERAIERLMRTRPELGGWWVRLAWARLRAGEVEPAAQALERGAKSLAQGYSCLPGNVTAAKVAALELLAPQARRLSATIRADGTDALPQLRVMVDKLEVMRRTTPVP